MKWRLNMRMHDKQELDKQIIAVKEAEHEAEYRARLEKKRLLGRFKMRPEGPRQKLYTDSTDPTLSVVVKGTFIV